MKEACDAGVFKRYLLFIFFSNFSAMASFLSLYLVSTGLDLALISWLLLIYQAVKLLLEVPSGYLSDRLGRKMTGLLGLIFILCYYASLLFGNTVVLAAGFVSRGLGFSLLSGSFEALYVESVDREKLVRNNTVERAIFYSSVGLGALLGGFLAAVKAYRLGIWIDVVCVAAALLVCSGFRDVRQHSYKNAMGARDAVKLLSCNVSLLCLFGMDCFLAFSFIGLEEYYTLFLGERGLDAQWAGLAVTAQLLLCAVVGLSVPRLISLFGRRSVFLCGLTVAMALSFAFLTSGVSAGVLPILYILSQIGFVFLSPIKYDLFQKSIPDGLRATFISMQSLMTSLGGLCFYGMSGLLSPILGLRGVLLVAFLVTVVSYVPCAIRVSRELT